MHYDSSFKLEALELSDEIGVRKAAEHNLNPNMIRTWKKEFIENAGRVFNERQSELIGISRSTHYYQPRKPSPEATDRKLIRRYMQEMCICPIYPKPNLSKRNHREPIVPYLLRNMEPHHDRTLVP